MSNTDTASRNSSSSHGRSLPELQNLPPSQLLEEVRAALVRQENSTESSTIRVGDLLLVLNPGGDDALFWCGHLISHGVAISLFLFLLPKARSRAELARRFPSLMKGTGSLLSRLAWYLEKHKIPLYIVRRKRIGMLVHYAVATEPAEERL